MSTTEITFDEVLRLAQRLPAADQARLRAELPDIEDEVASKLQRQKNQAAIDLLDAWKLEAESAVDDSDNDDWWDDFIRDLDAHRMSVRPLFSNQSTQS